MINADLFEMWIVLFAIYSTACFFNIIENTQPGHTIGTSDNADILCSGFHCPCCFSP
jgi:hypothetical protein